MCALVYPCENPLTPLTKKLELPHELQRKQAELGFHPLFLDHRLGRFRVMKKKPRKPDLTAGVFAVGFGSFCLLLVIFASADPSRKFYGTVAGVSLLGWGIAQISEAKKLERRQAEAAAKHDPHDPADVYDCKPDKFEKSGSMFNVLRLLVWIGFGFAAISALIIGYLFLFYHAK